MSCAICRRSDRGYGFSTFWNKDAPYRRACSRMCLDIIQVRTGDMFDQASLDIFERRGIEDASDAAGAFLETLGKTDLAQLTKAEWSDLLGIVFTTTAATIQKLSDEQAVPF